MTICNLYTIIACTKEQLTNRVHRIDHRKLFKLLPHRYIVDPRPKNPNNDLSLK